jgi:hypothetical protein
MEPPQMEPPQMEPHRMFLDPITDEVMKHPVVAADGFTYERSFIEKWFTTKDTSPITGAVMVNKVLIPNNSLLSEINQWREAIAKHPITITVINPVFRKTYSVQMILSDSIFMLKEKIHASEGFPPYQQRLIRGGKRIDSDEVIHLSLLDHDIKDGCIISMMVRIIGYPLIIRPSEGRPFSLCCMEHLYTIAEIKRRIESGLICLKDPSLTCEKIPFHQQRLILNGKELTDDEFPDPKLHGCILELVKKQ